MRTDLTFSDVPLTQLDAASRDELQALAAEAIGWQPLGQVAYLHLGDADGNVIHVVGVPDVAMAEMNVLLLV
jgi:hypothetical protein